MSAIERPTVVVPLLLSTGHHVMTDVPAAAALSAAPVFVAAPLGPNRLLARAIRRGCVKREGSGVMRIVLAAAGSTDPAGLADVEEAAALSRSEWGLSVTFACVSGTGPDVPTAVEHLRQSGADRVCVTPCLLAPGRFSRRVTHLATTAGATTIARSLAVTDSSQTSSCSVTSRVSTSRVSVRSPPRRTSLPGRGQYMGPCRGTRHAMSLSCVAAGQPRPRPHAPPRSSGWRQNPQQRAFLIVNLSGRALVRLAHVMVTGSQPSDGSPDDGERRDAAESDMVLPFDGGHAEHALSNQTM
jgi:sirohydrochlorin ferrochelatase